MIVKIVSSKGTGSFTGLANYLTDQRKQHQDKVEDIDFTNCHFEDLHKNLLHIEKAQSLNHSKNDKTLHLIVSFQEDEKPSKEILEDIEKELLKSIGLEDHHRLRVTHTNTNNYHFHLAVNRIDPVTHKRKDPYQSKRKLQKKAKELEVKHKLKRDNHGLERLAEREVRKAKKYNLERRNKYVGTGRGSSNQRRKSIVAALHKSSDRSTRGIRQAEALHDLPTLPGFNMVHKQPSIGEIKMLLQIDERYKLRFVRSRESGSSDRVRWSRTGDNENVSSRGSSGRVKDQEIHTGVESLTTWIKEEALEDITKTLKDPKSTLRDLHRVLAEYNLEILERGNGVVIKDKTRKLFIKASDVHRDLSKGKLKKRFGTFEKMSIDVKPKAQFGREKTEFWNNYKQEIDENRANKKDRLEILRSGYTKSKEKLYKDYKRERELLKLDRNMTSKAKKDLYSAYHATYRKKLETLQKEYSEAKKEVNDKYRYFNYKDYLIREALKGDTKALKALRVTKPPQPKEGENTLGNKSDHKIYIASKPSLTKRGFVVYRLDDQNDQSKIIDKGTHLKISNASDEAILRALEMARTKYGKDLNITGDDKFKSKVISLVHEHKLDIGFKDKSMQQILDAAKAQEQGRSSTPKTLKEKKGVER